MSALLKAGNEILDPSVSASQSRIAKALASPMKMLFLCREGQATQTMTLIENLTPEQQTAVLSVKESR